MIVSDHLSLGRGEEYRGKKMKMVLRIERADQEELIDTQARAGDAMVHTDGSVFNCFVRPKIIMFLSDSKIR